MCVCTDVCECGCKHAGYSSRVHCVLGLQTGNSLPIYSLEHPAPFNSDKIFDYGLHDLLVVLKSDKDDILDRITLPFMRVEMPSNEVPENFILIKPGDMLWTIAYRLYGDPFKYIQIFEENKDQITNPDLIFPGQLFSIPLEK